MTKDKVDFIGIIKTALVGLPYKETIDINKIMALSKYQSVEVMAYYGLKINGFEIDDNFKSKVQTLEYKAIVQDAEKISICDALSKNKIAHMPLKGAITSSLYEVRGMREMADLDILIKKEDFPKIKKIMIGLGYEIGHLGGNHDSYFKKPFMNIEIHRAMVDEEYEVNSYYEDIWERNIKQSDFEYYLKNEDFYIFMLVHAEKHFSHGGTGVKILADIYLYLKKYTETLDFNYINEELKKIKLLNFGTKLKNLALNIFENKELSKEEEIILDFILDSGTYGNIKNYNLVSGFLNEDEPIDKNKKTRLINRIFPSFNQMKRRNPILKKIPILLPWFYLTRLFKGMFNLKKHKQEIETINNISDEDVEKIKEVRIASGLVEDKNEN